MTLFPGIARFSALELGLAAAALLLFIAVSFSAIWSAYNRDFDSANEKMLWIQVSVLVPFLGGLVYFVVGRKRGRKQQ